MDLKEPYLSFTNDLHYLEPIISLLNKIQFVLQETLFISIKGKGLEILQDKLFKSIEGNPA